MLIHHNSHLEIWSFFSSRKAPDIWLIHYYFLSTNKVRWRTMQTGPPASERAGIYEWHHCASGGAASGRQWAFVCLHPIFFSRADAFVCGAARARAPTLARTRGFRQLPAVLKTAKQEQSDLLFLPRTSCSFLQWRETSSWAGEREERRWRLGGGRGGCKWMGEGAEVTETEACAAPVCACVLWEEEGVQRGCGLRLWENSCAVAGRRWLLTSKPQAFHLNREQ